MRACFTAACLLLVLTAPAAAEEESPTPPPPSTPEAVARVFLRHLVDDDLPAARAMLDAPMTNALPPGRLKAIWQRIVDRVGALEAMGEAKTAPVGVHHVVDVECTFASAILVLRVSVDAAGKIAGFFLIAERPREDDPDAISLETKTGVLHGTLDRPHGDGPWPVVLVIAGSGPTNRDGNNQQLANDHLKLLGQGLAARGVAAVRYDKRGIGASAAAGIREEDLRIEMLGKDAAAWVAKLRGDARFSRVVIVGHSEGSLIGMLASQQERPDAFVSIAGPGRPAADVLREQLASSLTGGWMDDAKAILAALTAGETVADVNPVLRSLFRPSVQAYLISWFRYDPPQELAKLEVPTLVVQGTTDLQVSTKDAELLVAGREGTRLLLVEGMNHVLKAARTEDEQTQTYLDPRVPVVPQLLDEVAVFAARVGAGKEVPAGR